MKLIVFFAMGVILIALQGRLVRSLCFSSICGNNSVRQTDNCGRGTYLASRSGVRLHKGVDIICPANSDVQAPFDGKIIRTARPYDNNNGPHNTGLLMQGTGKWAAYSVKMFYVRKIVKNGVYVRGGSNIGKMTNMAKQYRCTMTNHVHVQVFKNRKIADPTPYIC